MNVKTVTRTYYVADDGEEFTTKKECLAHEEEMHRNKEAEAARAAEIDALIDRIFDKQVSCDEGLIWDADLRIGILRSEAEYSALVEWAKNNCDYYSDDLDAPASYPSPYVFSLTQGTAYCEATTAEPWKWVTEYMDALAEVRAEMEKEQTK